MYIEKLTLLANHLAVKDYSTHDVLEYTLRVVLTPINCNSIIYFKADNFDRLFVDDMVGVSSSRSKEIQPSYSLSQQCPAAVAIRTGSIIWVDDSKDSFKKFPEIGNLSSLLQGNTLIAGPIFAALTPSSAITLFVDGDVVPDKQIDSFLMSVFGILGLYFSKT